jgi:hypothetical protein
LRDNKREILKQGTTEEEYEKELAAADAMYKPTTAYETVKANDGKHYTRYPISGATVSCRLEIEDIKNISFEEKDGFFYITINMKNYTYDNEKNPYPATSQQYQERESIPYGKVFNLPEINDSDNYSLGDVILENGKISVKIDSTTGRVIESDYNYKYSLEMYLKDDSLLSKRTELKMTMVATRDEYFIIHSGETEAK